MGTLTRDAEGLVFSLVPSVMEALMLRVRFEMSPKGLYGLGHQLFGGGRTFKIWDPVGESVCP